MSDKSVGHAILLSGAFAGFVAGCAVTWALVARTRPRPDTKPLKASIQRNATTEHPAPSPIPESIKAAAQVHKTVCALPIADIARFSRHVILPEFGPACQARLLDSSVLVVGTGGLAATIVPILAAAGVGRLGLVDDDVVEETNLQRQVFFSEQDALERRAKVDAMARRIRELNSRVRCDTQQMRITHANALQLVGQYDLVIDASDNLATRYLVNDACVLSHKPLVSGAAQGLQGQLSVYRNSLPLHDGANTDTSLLSCYRCHFPEPPAGAHQSNCNDAGVLSPVPPLVGCLQALEAIKVLVEDVDDQARKMKPLDSHILSLDLSDLSSGCWFMGKKRHTRREKCAVCGTHPTITNMEDSLAFAQRHKLVDAVCEAKKVRPRLADDQSPSFEHISPVQFVSRWLCSSRNHQGTPNLPFVLDVRPENEFSIGSLLHAHNLPLRELESACRQFADETWMNNLEDAGSRGDEVVRLLLEAVSEGTPVVVVCHRGNDSRVACGLLVSDAIGLPSEVVFNLSGGLAAWTRMVDPHFPTY
jgi:adenylyltransferase/sulfurtransferase